MRYLFLEDEGVVRTSVAYLIKAHFPKDEIIAVEFGEEAINLLNTEHFDVFISDLGLKSETKRTQHAKSIQGLNVIQHCKTVKPECKIIVLTAVSGIASVMAAYNQGIDGLLFKESSGDFIKPCILAVLDDKKYFDPKAKNLIDENRGNKNLPTIVLKKEENEVLQLVKKGYSSKDIAEMLQLNIRTVNYIMDKLYKKTDTQKNIELVAFAHANTVVIE